MSDRTERDRNASRASSLRRALVPDRLAEGTGTRRVRAALAAVSGHRSRFPVLTLAALVLLVVTGIWSNHALDEGLHQMYAQQIETVLGASIEALEVWAENEIQFASTWAADPDVEAIVARLRAVALEADAPAAALAASPALAELRTVLRPVDEAEDVEGWLVVDRSGLILAQRDEHGLMGRRLSSRGMGFVSLVLEGEPVLIRPIRRVSFIEGIDDLIDEKVERRIGRTTMGAAAPVHSADGTVTALLMIAIDPDGELTRILGTARLGDSGETYAFDHEGNLLTESRFLDDLKGAGLVPDTETASAIYTVQVRDPGGDITRGHVPAGPQGARPLTLAVASALEGADGFDLDGYRDCRGVKVVGGWRWLDRYGFGVATEVGWAAAFRLRRPLIIAFWAVLVLLGLATLSAVLSIYSIRFLSRRIDEVHQLGQYTLEEKLGEGGMGSVYLARHALLQRPTALKIIREDAATPENLIRFEREVQLTSRLTHPNTVEIFDFGHSPDGLFYYVMEYLAGVTVGRLVELERTVPPARAAHILRQACGSLEEAHDRGLIHRDIKPPNIMLCRRGLDADVVKVLDFGLVKEVSTPAELQVTAPDIVGGTPPYIAPERLKDPRRLDPRSDLYALGAVAYHMLTGRDTFEGASAMEICYKALHEPPPRPSEQVDHPIPEALERLVLDCLSPDPDERPASATVVIERLDALDDGGWGQPQARAWWDRNAARMGLDDDADDTIDVNGSRG
ncbi:MAG: serine/threonine-protein kinase [Planctomycetota bacterium]|jgi:hypothetical protein